MTISEKTHNHIYEMLLPRLNVVGTIRTSDAGIICMDHYAYSTISVVFASIMETMIEQGKAEAMMKQGQYVIIKPNQKYKVK